MRAVDNAAEWARSGCITARVQALDWEHIAAELDIQGYVVLEDMFSAAECGELAALGAQDELFHERILLEKDGSGERLFFRDPLPGTLAAWRAALYAPLAPVGNRWNAAMALAQRYPDRHEAFLERCRAAGQLRPASFLSRYPAGGFDGLRQDAEGANIFPVQVEILLSCPGTDFTGGEFVMTEQRPRMQSRPMVVAMGQGSLALLAVHHRPFEGASGIYRVNARHGVSRVRSGRREALSLLFHNASGD